ncbi:MAG: CxxxxCH/CxxCH domain c-type cytochrome, partial [Myxococcaceae bacterium]
AHREHLQALHQVSAPVPCNECHLVPRVLNSPGHIDHPPPAIVFPPGTGTLANTDGVDAGYNFSTATCTVYCHGSGTRLSKDTSTGLNHAPIFNGGTSQAACGNCHGIPTKIPGTHHHDGVTSITQCATCHPTTIAPSGNIIVGADGGSTHVNGVVNVGP